MIEIELSEFTRLSTDGMLDYLSKHLPASLCETDRCAANEASVVRNLIIHNAAIANEELHQLNSEHQVGRTIRLSGTQVHNYGLRGRQLLRTIDEQLVEKGHLSAHAQT